MKKTTALAAALVLCMAVLPCSATAEIIGTGSSGITVYRVQQRLFDLDYFNYKPTANFGSLSRDAVMRFQEYNGLSADGAVGEQTKDVLFSPNVKRMPILASIPFGITEGNGTQGGANVSWSEVNASFPAGTTAKITDYITGTSFSMTRRGGENHATVVPASAADEQSYLTVFDGTPNWSKRACVVEISGRRIAASITGMPRGSESWVAEGVTGTIELYFSDSTADFAPLNDTEHNANIRKATAAQ